MNIIAVDDEHSALWMLERAILDVDKDANVVCFEAAEDALKYAYENTVDVAFLDIEMAEMNGLVLAGKLKEIHGTTNIIFVTGYSSYMKKAFEIYASGYVLKPIDPKRVKQELNHLRNPVKQESSGIRIQCFGSFEVFSDRKPVVFGRAKSKEVLAYLVDRKGASVSKKELAAVLWGDVVYTRSIQSHLYILISEMIQVLENVGVGNIIIKKRGLYSIDTANIECDYYNYENGDMEAINRYRGEYMSNYSWAEFTAGRLEHWK